MKIYLFDPETGIYQGEDFSDDRPVGSECEAVTPYATTLAPPDFRSGEVPIFRAAENRWEIRQREIRMLHVAVATGDRDQGPSDGDSGHQARRLQKPSTYRWANDAADEMV